MGRCPICGKKISFLRTELVIKKHGKFFKTDEQVDEQTEKLDAKKYLCPECGCRITNSKKQALKFLRSELEQKVEEY